MLSFDQYQKVNESLEGKNYPQYIVDYVIDMAKSNFNIDFYDFGDGILKDCVDILIKYKLPAYKSNDDSIKFWKKTGLEDFETGVINLAYNYHLIQFGYACDLNSFNVVAVMYSSASHKRIVNRQHNNRNIRLMYSKFVPKDLNVNSYEDIENIIYHIYTGYIDSRSEPEDTIREMVLKIKKALTLDNQYNPIISVILDYIDDAYPGFVDRVQNAEKHKDIINL